MYTVYHALFRRFQTRMVPRRHASPASSAELQSAYLDSGHVPGETDQSHTYRLPCEPSRDMCFSPMQGTRWLSTLILLDQGNNHDQRAWEAGVVAESLVHVNSQAPQTLPHDQIHGENATRETHVFDARSCGILYPVGYGQLLLMLSRLARIMVSRDERQCGRKLTRPMGARTFESLHLPSFSPLPPLRSNLPLAESPQHDSRFTAKSSPKTSIALHRQSHQSTRVLV
jgi:hypothetical protein